METTQTQAQAQPQSHLVGKVLRAASTPRKSSQTEKIK